MCTVHGRTNAVRLPFCRSWDMESTIT